MRNDDPDFSTPSHRRRPSKPKHRLTQALLLLPISLVLSLNAYATSVSATSDRANDTPAARVNGSTISKDMLLMLSDSRSQGPLSALQQDQQQVLNDLITTELLSQEAIKHGTDAVPHHALELELARKTLLSQLYVKDFLDQLVISESEIKASYDAMKDQTMVQLGFWRFTDKTSAQSFLDVQTTDSSETPPSTQIEPWQSLDSTSLKDHLTTQSVTQGMWLPAVIQEGESWQVWRFLKVSAIKRPKFEDVKEVIEQELKQARLHDHIEALRASATIVMSP